MTLYRNVHRFWETTRSTVRLAWENAPQLTLGVAVATLFSSILPALQLWVGRGLINAIFDMVAGTATNTGTILWWLGINLVAILLQFSATTLKTFFGDRLSEQIRFELDLRILTHATKLDLAFYEDVGSQDTLARTQENISNQVSGFVVTILNLVSQFLQSVSIIVVVLLIDPVGVVVMLPLLLAYVIVQWRFVQKQFKLHYLRTMRRRWSRYFVGRVTNAESVPEAKMLNIAPLFVERYSQLQREFMAEDRRIREQHTWIHFGLEALFAVVYIAIWGLQIRWVLAGALKPGDWITYGRALLQLQQIIRGLGSSSGGVFNQMLYVNSLEEFLSAQPSVPSGTKEPPNNLVGPIEFEEVTFTYPGASQPTLHNVSFKVEPGQMVAIVGENGAGKSTLAKLLMRLYSLPQGKITICGVNIADMDLNAYYRLVAYMPQHVNRYEATAGENIAYGNWEGLHNRPTLIKAIAKRVGIDSLIEALPQSYDTMLGRRFGTYDLSGGQWQRLAIARIIARDPSILIWDEPTSNLDAKAEASLMTYLREVAQGKTTFLISHRFSNIHLADRIIVLNGGRIVESGTHDELLAKKGHYASLYELHRREMK